MSRRNVMLGGVLVLLVALVATVILRTLSGPPANRLLVAGDARAVARTLSAPVISYPNADYSVSVPSNAAAGASVITLARTTPRPTGAPVSAGRPVVSGRLTRVYVQMGDHVATGQVVAQLDTTLLDLGVQQAKINAARTRNNVRVLKNTLDTIADNQDKVSTGWSALATGKTQLAQGETQIATGKAALLKAKAGLLSAQAKLLEAKRNRGQLEDQLAVAKANAAVTPPGPKLQKLKGQIGQLQGLLAGIAPGLAKIGGGLKQVNAGLAKIAVAEATLAMAQGKMATAAGQLATASDALKTAKKQVVRARDSLAIIADAQHLIIALAQAKVMQATLVAPAAGVVTQAAAQGTVAMVGSPIVRITPDEPTLVDTYLTGTQLGGLHVGSLADITYDSSSGKSVRGALAFVDDQALFPPTAFPTDIVHMTRTVKVTFRLDSGENPPPGTPVDIAIHTD